MAVSLNDLLRMQSRQGSPSTAMTLSYTPEPRTGELPPQPTPKAGMLPTYVPGGATPPEVFPQQTDPSDYARSSLRAQLQVDDPSSPANAMSALARKWYDWRTQPTTLERALDPRKMRFDAFGRETPAVESLQTLPYAPEEEMPGSPGNLAGVMRRRLPPHLPGRVRSAIEDIIERLTEQAKTPGLTPKGNPMQPITLPTPRVDWLEEFYRRGQYEPPWYAGSPQAFERLYGDLSPLSLGFNAAASMNATPYAQIDLANEGLRRFVESGRDPSALRRIKPRPGETIDQMKGLGQVSREMEQMARLWLKDRNAVLTSVFNPKTFKRTDYHDVMAGKRHEPVIDTHMGRIGYGLIKPIPPTVLDLTELEEESLGVGPSEERDRESRAPVPHAGRHREHPGELPRGPSRDVAGARLGAVAAAVQEPRGERTARGDARSPRPTLEGLRVSGQLRGDEAAAALGPARGHGHPRDDRRRWWRRWPRRAGVDASAVASAARTRPRRRRGTAGAPPRASGPRDRDHR